MRAWQTRTKSIAVAGFFYADMNVGGSSLEPELTQGARLRDGYTEAQAQTELAAITRQLETGDPANAGIGVRVISPREETVQYNQQHPRQPRRA